MPTCLVCLLVILSGPHHSASFIALAAEICPSPRQAQPLSLPIANLRAQAEAGDAEAQDMLGAKYLTGDDVEQNKEEAVSWFRKAARQGNSSAMYHLGAAYYNGDGVTIDDSLSYAWFRLSKEAGNRLAADAVQRAESTLKEGTLTTGLTRIAEMYEPGGRLPENLAEAARWWNMVAQRGDAQAQVRIANKFLEGQGVPKDYAQARHLCRQAAEQNDIRAEFCLGMIYDRGLGVDRDPKEARKWYELAAVKGHLQATKSLAVMEESGDGGKVNRVKAFLLYVRLFKSGDQQNALHSLAKLRKEITAGEWESLQKPLRELRIDPAKLDLVLKQTKTD